MTITIVTSPYIPHSIYLRGTRVFWQNHLSDGRSKLTEQNDDSLQLVCMAASAYKAVSRGTRPQRYPAPLEAALIRSLGARMHSHESDQFAGLFAEIRLQNWPCSKGLRLRCEIKVKRVHRSAVTRTSGNEPRDPKYKHGRSERGRFKHA